MNNVTLFVIRVLFGKELFGKLLNVTESRQSYLKQRGATFHHYHYHFS